MAILSKGITLSYSGTATGTYNTITGLQSVPALGGTKDKVDVTTLADSSYKYIAGIKSFDDLEFGFVYDKSVFDTLNGLTGTQYWKVTFPDGVVFSFSGECYVVVQGAEVNGAITMNLTVILGSDITAEVPVSQVTGPTGTGN